MTLSSEKSSRDAAELQAAFPSKNQVEAHQETELALDGINPRSPFGTSA
jgi:hypothetical protein